MVEAGYFGQLVHAVSRAFFGLEEVVDGPDAFGHQVAHRGRHEQRDHEVDEVVRQVVWGERLPAEEVAVDPDECGSDGVVHEAETRARLVLLDGLQQRVGQHQVPRADGFAREVPDGPQDVLHGLGRDGRVEQEVVEYREQVALCGCLERLRVSQAHIRHDPGQLSST